MYQRQSFLPSKTPVPTYFDNSYKKNGLMYDNSLSQMKDSGVNNNSQFGKPLKQSNYQQQMVNNQYQFQQMNTNNFDKNLLLTEFKKKMRFYQKEFIKLTKKELHTDKDIIYFRKMKLDGLVNFIDNQFPQNLIQRDFYCHWIQKEDDKILVWNNDSSYEINNQLVQQLNVLQIDDLSPLYTLVVEYKQTEGQLEYLIIYTSKQHDQIHLFDFFNNQAIQIYKYYKFDEIKLFQQKIYLQLQKWLEKNPEFGQNDSFYSGTELKNQEKQQLATNVYLTQLYKTQTIHMQVIQQDQETQRQKEEEFLRKQREQEERDRLLREQMENEEREKKLREQERLEQERLEREKEKNKNKNQQRQSQIQNSEKQFQLKLSRITQFLVSGFTLKKYGLSMLTNGNMRTFYFESDLKEFYYCSENQHDKEKSKTFKFSAIDSIIDGRLTKNFLRFKAKTHDQYDLSFSIVTSQRSLDLQAQSFAQKETILEALQFLEDNKQKIFGKNYF